MGASNYVFIDVEEVVKETENAFLFRVDGLEVWIPKSQMADPGDYKEGDTELEGVAITKWIADQKGLEGND